MDKIEKPTYPSHFWRKAKRRPNREVRIQIRCNRRHHVILLTKRGKLILLDHDHAAEKAAISLGCSPPPCLEVLRILRNHGSIIGDRSQEGNWLKSVIINRGDFRAVQTNSQRVRNRRYGPRMDDVYRQLRNLSYRRNRRLEETCRLIEQCIEQKAAYRYKTVQNKKVSVYAYPQPDFATGWRPRNPRWTDNKITFFRSETKEARREISCQDEEDFLIQNVNQE